MIVPSYKVVNVVATCDIGQRIQLEPIAELDGGLYDFDTYRCAYLKDDVMYGKVNIFGTGKLISIGTRTHEQAEADLRHVVERLHETGLVGPTAVKAKIRNVVAVSDLGRRLDLNVLAQEDDNVVYDPESFPGAVYVSPSGLKFSALIFASGKVVIIGIKEIDKVSHAVSELGGLFGLGIRDDDTSAENAVTDVMASGYVSN